MGKTWATWARIGIVVNVILWILNWVFIGFWIYFFWQDHGYYAGVLLLHILTSNVLQSSIYGAVPIILMDEEQDLESPGGITTTTIERHTSQYPPPFWKDMWEPSKEV